MHEISIVIGVIKISFRPSSNDPDEKFWDLQIETNRIKSFWDLIEDEYHRESYTFKTSNLVEKQRIFGALNSKYPNLMRIANILMEVDYPSKPSGSVLEILFAISSMMKIEMRRLSISLDTNMMDPSLSDNLTSDYPVWKLHIKYPDGLGQIYYSHRLKKEEAEKIFIDSNFKENLKELVIKLKSDEYDYSKIVADKIESAIAFENQEQKNKLTKYYTALAETKQTSPSFFQNVPKPIMLRIAAFAAKPDLKVITADEISKHLLSL